MDDHSRFCVSAMLLRRPTARAVCAAFADAMRRHGMPGEVVTDNGRVFTGRFGAGEREVLFDRICRENGINHRLTAPYSPTTTGKIERFHRMLRAEFLAGRSFDSLVGAQRDLDGWVDDYNPRRPHQGIGMATPVQRFTGTGDLPGRLLDAGALQSRTGVDWVSRRVGGNGVICVTYQQLSVGKHRAGTVVDVHLNGELLHIWAGSQLIKTVARTERREVRKERAAAAR